MTTDADGDGDDHGDKVMMTTMAMTMASGEDDDDAMVMGWQFLAGRLPTRIITALYMRCSRPRSAR